MPIDQACPLQKTRDFGGVGEADRAEPERRADAAQKRADSGAGMSEISGSGRD
jgi:hypothetical protein